MSTVAGLRVAIRSVLERATARQPNITQDCPVFFIQLNYVHNYKKMRYYYLMLNSPAIRWHCRFHFLFLDSAILHSCIFCHSCLYLLKSPFNTCHPSVILLECVLVYIYKYAFRQVIDGIVQNDLKKTKYFTSQTSFCCTTWQLPQV